jgi:single-strand DNA-binding protein
MNGINNVTIIGNVGNVSEIINVNSGRFVTLSIATTEYFSNLNNEKKSKTLWHSVVLWNNMSELVKMIEKGDLIYVEGRLNYREKPNDNSRYTEIVAKTIRVLKKANPKKEEVDFTYNFDEE